MKTNLLLILSIFLLSSFMIDRGINEVPLNVPGSHGHNHNEINIPADMPDVYYDSELDVITIVDYANVTYYVTIYDDWWNAVITDTKPGGGTINVSSLTSGDYVIEITTSWNNQYEGTFTVP